MGKQRPITSIVDPRVAELLRERDALHNEVVALRQDVAAAEKAHDNLAVAASELRIQLKDMREHRDRAQHREQCAAHELREAERVIQRLLGWIDAKQDKPPAIERTPETPF
jgi:chromosome segregation ATPase